MRSDQNLDAICVVEAERAGDRSRVQYSAVTASIEVELFTVNWDVLVGSASKSLRGWGDGWFELESEASYTCIF